MKIKKIQYCSMIDHIKSEAISFCPESEDYQKSDIHIHHGRNPGFSGHHVEFRH